LLHDEIDRHADISTTLIGIPDALSDDRIEELLDEAELVRGTMLRVRIPPCVEKFRDLYYRHMLQDEQIVYADLRGDSDRWSQLMENGNKYAEEAYDELGRLAQSLKPSRTPTRTPTRMATKTPTRTLTLAAPTPPQTLAQQGIALDGWKFRTQPQRVIDAFADKYGEKAAEMWANERNMFMGYIPSDLPTDEPYVCEGNSPGPEYKCEKTKAMCKSGSYWWAFTYGGAPQDAKHLCEGGSGFSHWIYEWYDHPYLP
jgi:hypothetical protein